MKSKSQKLESKSQKLRNIHPLGRVHILKHVVGFLGRSNLEKVIPSPIFKIKRLMDDASTGRIKMGTFEFKELARQPTIPHFKCKVNGSASIKSLANLPVRSLTLIWAKNLSVLLKMPRLKKLTLKGFSGSDLSPILSLKSLTHLEVDSCCNLSSLRYVYAPITYSSFEYVH